LVDPSQLREAAAVLSEVPFPAENLDKPRQFSLPSNDVSPKSSPRKLNLHN
jgi:hypothetical protein